MKIGHDEKNELDMFMLEIHEILETLFDVVILRDLRLIEQRLDEMIKFD